MMYRQEWLSETVFGLVPGGGYAQYVALSAEHLIKKPATLGMSEAAACAEVFLTAFQAMRVVGNLPDQGGLVSACRGQWGRHCSYTAG